MKLSDMIKLNVPEGATHFIVDDEVLEDKWYKVVNGKLFSLPMDGSTGHVWKRAIGGMDNLRRLDADRAYKFEQHKHASFKASFDLECSK